MLVSAQEHDLCCDAYLHAVVQSAQTSEQFQIKKVGAMHASINLCSGIMLIQLLLLLVSMLAVLSTWGFSLASCQMRPERP